MNRRLVFLSLIVLLIAQLAPTSATACDKSCDVERSCEKTDSGIRCTILAKGETTIDQVRKCVQSCASKHHSSEGVTVTFEEIEGGIAIIRAATDAETIKVLHEHAEGCAKNHHGCCAKHDQHQAKQQAKADKDCATPCSSPCPHAKAK